jgi:hypothetical protein
MRPLCSCYGRFFAEARTVNRGFLIKVLFWGLFIAGIVVQILAPNLKIADHKFVMPVSKPGTEMNAPEVLVKKERRMHLAAALLVVSGASGLGFVYRDFLFKKSAPNHAPITQPTIFK